MKTSADIHSLNSWIGTLVACALAALIQTEAHAQDTTDDTKSDWKYSLGGEALIMPDYEGSKHYVPTGLPIFSVNWRDTVSLGSEGLKATWHYDNFFLTGGAGYWLGRREGADEDHGDYLRGLGNISGNAIGTIEAGYKLGRLTAAIGASRDIGGDRDGTTSTLRLAYEAIHTKDFKVTLRASSTWADDNYMSTMFGITQEQSAASTRHYATYDAQAGVKDGKGGFLVNYNVTDSVSLLAMADAEYLLGNAADSPIVKNGGSRTQFTGGLGFAYHF